MITTSSPGQLEPSLLFPVGTKSCHHLALAPSLRAAGQRGPQLFWTRPASLCLVTCSTSRPQSLPRAAREEREGRRVTGTGISTLEEIPAFA